MLYHKLEEIKDGSLCTKPRVVSPINRLGATDEKGSAEYDIFDHRPTVLMPRDSNEGWWQIICNGEYTVI